MQLSVNYLCYKDIKVVQFKTSLYNTRKRVKKKDKIRVKNKSLMLRKIEIIKILIENLFISEYFQ